MEREKLKGGEELGKRWELAKGILALVDPAKIAKDLSWPRVRPPAKYDGGRRSSKKKIMGGSLGTYKIGQKNEGRGHLKDSQQGAPYGWGGGAYGRRSKKGRRYEKKKSRC